MQECQRVAVGRGAHRLRKIDDLGVGLRQRRFAQEELRRKTLDRVPDQPTHVLGIDLAIDGNRQLAERSFGGEGMDDVAEGILVLMQQAIVRQIDAPGDNVLSVVIARG